MSQIAEFPLGMWSRAFATQSLRMTYKAAMARGDWTQRGSRHCLCRYSTASKADTRNRSHDDRQCCRSGDATRKDRRVFPAASTLTSRALPCCYLGDGSDDRCSHARSRCSSKMIHGASAKLATRLPDLRTSSMRQRLVADDNLHCLHCLCPSAYLAHPACT